MTGGQLSKAESVASKVREQFSMDTLPICPFEIADKCGILVEPKDSSNGGVTGFLIRQGNAFGICHASHIKNEGFIRFTIAHELGHYFLPGHPESIFPNGDGIHRSRAGTPGNDPLEKEADSFASALLMPHDLFLDEIRKREPGFEAIESIADLCITSLTATAIQYARFSEDPIAVIVSSGTRIEYCFASDVIDNVEGLKRIRKGKEIPDLCKTRTFNATKSNVSCGRKAAGWTSLDDWFEGAPQVEMKEDVVGLGAYEKTLTVLFTEELIEDE